MKRPRIVIAGTHSGVGKSTASLGLMAAFRKRGLEVQSFKVGPDYIDPSYHTAITGRTSRNLDSWMLTKDTVLKVFVRASECADISIVEGVMGLYDGKDVMSNEGSTAEMSMLLDCPVLLVVDVGGMARSAAAMVKGYQSFSDKVNIAGVIANRVGGEGHYRLIQQVVEHECGIPVVGYLTPHSEIEIPERHLGLIPAIERGEHTPLFEELCTIASSTFDLDTIYAIASAAPAFDETVLNETTLSQVGIQTKRATSKVKIAVARDAAFNFYYAENLEFLEHYGAELLYFSPLCGDVLPPEAQGLYIGGGFPEEFAANLSAHQQQMAYLRSEIERGLPTYAECGGYMYLTEELTDLHGQSHSMVGIIPARVTMQNRLSNFGYREVAGVEGNWLLHANQIARGHEFHYSSIEYRTKASPAYLTTGTYRPVPQEEGYWLSNLVAGYTHLHFASNPVIARQFVERCASYQTEQERK